MIFATWKFEESSYSWVCLLLKILMKVMYSEIVLLFGEGK